MLISALASIFQRNVKFSTSKYLQFENYVGLLDYSLGKKSEKSDATLYPNYLFIRHHKQTSTSNSGPHQGVQIAQLYPENYLLWITPIMKLHGIGIILSQTFNQAKKLQRNFKRIIFL